MCRSQNNPLKSILQGNQVIFGSILITSLSAVDFAPFCHVFAPFRHGGMVQNL